MQYNFAARVSWLCGVEDETLIQTGPSEKYGGKAMKAITGCLGLLMIIALIPGAGGATLPSSCGPQHTKAHVQLNRSPAKLAAIPSGDARLVFVQQPEPCYGCAVVQVGVNGRWVGRNEGKSWFAVTVPSGEQHVCAWWATRMIVLRSIGLDHRIVLTDLDAKAGQTYYFKARIDSSGSSWPTLRFHQISSDEGEFMVSHTRESIASFKTKK